MLCWRWQRATGPSEDDPSDRSHRRGRPCRDAQAYGKAQSEVLRNEALQALGKRPWSLSLRPGALRRRVLGQRFSRSYGKGAVHRQA
eukprot:10046429-Prorocentrum_lima.AAC.1